MVLNSPTVRILAGLLAGLALGAALAAYPSPLTASWPSLGALLGGLWLDALRMTIVPLVFALLVVGVAHAAGTVRAGGLAGRALVAFAGLLAASTLVTALAAPALLQAWPAPAEAAGALRAQAAGGAAKVPALPPVGEWVKSFIPVNPIRAAADGAMVSIVIFALAFGLAASRLVESQRSVLFHLFDAIQAAMLEIVRWVLWAAPVGVFFLAAAVGAQTGLGAVGLLGHYVAVVSLMCLAGGGIGLLTGLIGGRISPGRLLGALIPVEAMAISTQSSLASMPVMLEAARRLQIGERARALVLPMAVALFRITSPAGNLAVAIYVAHLYGVALDPGRLAAGAGVAVLVSLGAVGVASSVTFFTTLVPIFAIMGVPMDLLPLLLAVETLPDFSRTVGNVTAHVGVTAWARRWVRDDPPD